MRRHAVAVCAPRPAGFAETLGSRRKPFLSDRQRDYGCVTKARSLTIIFNAGVFLLLVALVLEAADIRRSLRRIEHEERELVHGHYTPHPLSPPEQAAYLREAHKYPGLDQLNKWSDGRVIVHEIGLQIGNNGEMVWHVGTCLAQDGHPGAEPSKAFAARIRAEFAKHSTKRVLIEPTPMARPLIEIAPTGQ